MYVYGNSNQFWSIVANVFIDWVHGVVIVTELLELDLSFNCKLQVIPLPSVAVNVYYLQHSTGKNKRNSML